MLTTRMPIEAKCTLRAERKCLFCMERSEKRKPVNVNSMSKNGMNTCVGSWSGLTWAFKNCGEMLTTTIAIKKNDVGGQAFKIAFSHHGVWATARIQRNIIMSKCTQRWSRQSSTTLLWDWSQSVMNNHNLLYIFNIRLREVT